MVTKLTTPGVSKALATLLVLFSVMVAKSHGNPLGGQIPQIPAFLPMSMDVPMTQKLAIDGEWMISTIKKRIRIEGGRAYALDSWLHLFVLKIEPLMVVSKNWRRTGPGEYAGEDLPLMGQFTARLNPNGNLDVDVAGALGPVKFALIPVRIDDQRRFDRAKAGKNDRPVASGQNESEDYAVEDDYQQGEYVEDKGYEDGYSEDDYTSAEGEEGYSDGEEYYSEGDETYDEGDEQNAAGEEVYGDGEEYSDEGQYEEPAAKKVKAIAVKKARKGCKGKQIYMSRGACFACPNGYKRFSPTRKMTHPKACVKRGLGLNKPKVKAKYLWQANGCPKGQFKHKGVCKICPEGTKRIHVAGLDNGFCKVL